MPQRKTNMYVTPDLDSDSASTWKIYFYAQFPWPFTSMKRIEGHLDSRPILKGLSGDPLPLTDHPLSIHRSMSRISRQINGKRQTMMDSTSWLSTDEIQFLLAFLLCNEENNSGVFHVLGPMITHKVALVYEVMPAILNENATEMDQRTYQSNMEGIQAYIESRLDIFEHKFLVFVCNINNMHWVSVVVVNPFLVFDPYLAEGKQKAGNEDFVGWCVLNSTKRQAEKNNVAFRELHLPETMQHMECGCL